MQQLEQRWWNQQRWWCICCSNSARLTKAPQPQTNKFNFFHFPFFWWTRRRRRRRRRAWPIGLLVVVVLLLLLLSSSSRYKHLLIYLDGWGSFLGSLFFFLINSFHLWSSRPSHGKRYIKMAIIITISREHLAKSG
jgi:hypothetical protein